MGGLSLYMWHQFPGTLSWQVMPNIYLYRDSNEMEKKEHVHLKIPQTRRNFRVNVLL